MKIKKSILLFICLLLLCTFKIDTFAATKLAAPKGVTVTADSKNVISIYWSKVSGASYYRMYYSSSLNGKYKEGIKSSDNGRSLYGVKKGQKVYIKVKAFKSGAASAYSKVASIYIKSCPSAPKKVKATYSKATGKVTIKWDKVSGANNYYLYCSSSKSIGYSMIFKGGVPIKYTKTSASLLASSYGLKEDETWYFKVTAVKDKMESKESSSASVKIVSDKVKCFPQLTDVPVIPNISYETDYSSDGTAVYYTYKVSDLNGSIISNYESMLKANGWILQDKNEDNGYPIYTYSNGKKEIYIAFDDTYFEVYGSLWQN